MQNRTIRVIALSITLLSVVQYFHSPLKGIFYSIFNYFDKLPLNIDKVYVINLDRRPDRMISATKELNYAKIPFTRFPAIDALELCLTDLNTGKIFHGSKIHKIEDFFIKNKTIFKVSHKNFEDSSFIFDNTHSSKTITDVEVNKKPDSDFAIDNLGEIGCAYSHIALMKDILKNNYKVAIIFEDDIVLFNNFLFNLKRALQNIPKDADIIYIDGNSYSKSKLQYFNPYLNKSSTIIERTHAYIVTRKGAKKLLKTFTNVRHVIDFHIPNLHKNGYLNIYIFRKKVADQNRDLSSDISHKYKFIKKIKVVD